jgi:transposase InsO family protein
MVIEMNDSRLATLAQIREFLDGTADVGLQPKGSRAQRYAFVQRTLVRLVYRGLARPEKSLVRAYLARMTGFSRAQLTRLLAQYAANGRVQTHYKAPVAGLQRRFGPAACLALAELDELHETLSGPATVHLCRRAWQVYGDARYEQLATISVAHLYNLRATPVYRQRRVRLEKTRTKLSGIGVRKAPAPDGRPGFIRIDTVHQGDRDGLKGVYHINAVDCVTQWQLVACCERISEAFLLPVISLLLEQFPFQIRGFHSDGGGEFVNHDVARLLEKLRIEFTKSRPRQCNDNALAETKNGAVVRKFMGYSHIPQRFATRINAFYTEHLNPYLNLHRPCLFATERTDAKGRVRKTYFAQDVQTPLEKLSRLPDVDQSLKPGLTLPGLLHQAAEMTDNDAARALQRARSALFKDINRRSNQAA